MAPRDRAAHLARLPADTLDGYAARVGVVLERRRPGEVAAAAVQRLLDVFTDDDTSAPGYYAEAARAALRAAAIFAVCAERPLRAVAAQDLAALEADDATPRR